MNVAACSYTFNPPIVPVEVDIRFKGCDQLIESSICIIVMQHKQCAVRPFNLLLKGYGLSSNTQPRRSCNSAWLVTWNESQER